MPTPCDLAWSHLDADTALPPLTVDEPNASTWASAFQTRDDLLQLFNGFSPFFTIPDAVAEGTQLRMDLGLAIQQAETQRNQRWWTLRGLPNTSNRKKMFVISMRGDPGSGRPFCQFMADPYIDQFLRSYVQAIAARMMRSARRVEQANLVVYLVARHWALLDPLRRAQGVLAGKGYTEYIKRQAQAAGHPSAPSLGHRHFASLTARQARRSTVSQAELWSRWE